MIRREIFAGISLQLIYRVIGIYTLTLLSFFIMSSNWLADYMEHSYKGPEGFNNFPIVLVGLLLGWLTLHIHQKKTPVKPQTKNQLLLGSILTTILVVASYHLTHPSLPQFFWQSKFMHTHPIHGPALIASLLYIALLLPLPGLIATLLPINILKKHRWFLTAQYIILVSYILSNVIEAMYHLSTVQYTLRGVHAVLQILPGTTYVNPGRLELAYQHYQVVVGPVCSGLTMLTLFTAFFGYLWVKLKKHTRFSPKRALCALCAGWILIFSLNILRIALIMIVGAYAPAQATDLFHSTIAAALFFGLFMIYLKMVTPKLLKPKG